VTNALPQAFNLSTEGSGIFDLNGYSQTVANISGGSGTIMDSGTTSNVNGYVNGDVLTVGNNSPTNATATYGGQIIGNLNLVKQGSSSLTLSGINTYYGSTAVQAGSLIVSGSLNGTIGVDVKGHATFGGSGSVTTGVVAAGSTLNGNVLLEPNSFLAPTAESTFTMSLGSGALDLRQIAGTNTNALQFSINPLYGTNGEVNLTSGSLDIGSNSLDFGDFGFSFVNPITTPDTYTLFNTNSAIVGTLGADLSGTVQPGWTGTIEEVGTSQIDLVIQSVPEPNALSMLAGSFGMALGLQRFRRRRRNERIED
jgi:autotransporter-associated beta strand protein